MKSTGVAAADSSSCSSRKSAPGTCPARNVSRPETTLNGTPAPTSAGSRYVVQS